MPVRRFSKPSLRVTAHLPVAPLATAASTAASAMEAPDLDAIIDRYDPDSTMDRLKIHAIVKEAMVNAHWIASQLSCDRADTRLRRS